MAMHRILLCYKTTIFVAPEWRTEQTRKVCDENIPKDDRLLAYWMLAKGWFTKRHPIG